MILWTKVLGKFIFAQVIKKFSAFYEIRSFITVLNKVDIGDYLELVESSSQSDSSLL